MKEKMTRGPPSLVVSDHGPTSCGAVPLTVSSVGSLPSPSGPGGRERPDEIPDGPAAAPSPCAFGCRGREIGGDLTHVPGLRMQRQRNHGSGPYPADAPANNQLAKTSHSRTFDLFTERHLLLVLIGGSPPARDPPGRPPRGAAAAGACGPAHSSLVERPSRASTNGAFGVRAAWSSRTAPLDCPKPTTKPAV